jgi:hypothetical protein
LKINILAKKAKNTVERSEIPHTCGEGVTSHNTAQIKKPLQTKERLFFMLKNEL